MKMTCAELAAYFRRFPKRLEREVKAAEKATLAEAWRIAYDLSSGTYSTAQLIRMGYPYSRRRPNPPQDAAIVNVQSGRFRDSWKTRTQGWKISTAGAVTTGILINTAPYAPQMWGTAYMIPRLITLRVGQRVKRIRRKNLETAIENAMKP